MWAAVWSADQQTSFFDTRATHLHRSLLVPDWCNDDDVMQSDFTLPELRDPYLDQRIVEFVLSLPALPWLFNKSILRRSMENYLPHEITARPKTALGSLQHSLLKSSDAQWINEWRPSPETELYVERYNLNLTQLIEDPISSYINMRPLRLNQWLERNRKY